MQRGKEGPDSTVLSTILSTVLYKPPPTTCIHPMDACPCWRSRYLCLVRLHAAKCAAHDHSHPGRVFLLHDKLGVLKSQPAGRHGEVGETVVASDALRIREIVLCGEGLRDLGRAEEKKERKEETREGWMEPGGRWVIQRKEVQVEGVM